MSENLRYERGKNIALHRKIKRVEPRTTAATMWKVESETVDDLMHTVIMFSDGKVICTCKDYDRHEETCKHIYAVCVKETATTPQQLGDE